jgi:SAM-dependent methyltransferase
MDHSKHPGSPAEAAAVATPPPGEAPGGAASVATLRAQLAAWAGGIAHELQFWDAWLASRGLQWPEDYARRMDPAAPLDARAAQLAPGLARGGRLRVLDVGAGPVTILGYRLPGVAVEVTATDPLAPQYAALLARHGAAPPVPTRFAPAEDLRLFVPEGGFDLVHCRNALDHSFDPLRGIEQMLAAARTGGAVLLSHFEDEAEREGYSGLHQWNFAARDGGARFVIWNSSSGTGRPARSTWRPPCAAPAASPAAPRAAGWRR